MKAASSIWRLNAASQRRAAHGTPTAKNASAKAGEAAKQTLRENPDMRDEIERRVREAYDIPVIDADFRRRSRRTCSQGRKEEVMDAPAYDTVLTNLRTRIREIEDGVDDAACLTHASSHQEDPNESDRAFQKILRCASVREQSTARMRSKLKNADFSSGSHRSRYCEVG